ncbi:hypothetical protein PENSPDRAFT_265670 [Peniophora sp. CONT]|nr:hypothetical protein PENSPDRAFT_265670 [Peniophora sp. CONT]
MSFLPRITSPSGKAVAHLSHPSVNRLSYRLSLGTSTGSASPAVASGSSTLAVASTSSDHVTPPAHGTAAPLAAAVSVLGSFFRTSAAHTTLLAENADLREENTRIYNENTRLRAENSHIPSLLTQLFASQAADVDSDPVLDGTYRRFMDDEVERLRSKLFASDRVVHVLDPLIEANRARDAAALAAAASEIAKLKARVRSLEVDRVRNDDALATATSEATALKGHIRALKDERVRDAATLSAATSEVTALKGRILALKEEHGREHQTEQQTLIREQRERRCEVQGMQDKLASYKLEQSSNRKVVRAKHAKELKKCADELAATQRTHASYCEAMERTHSREMRELDDVVARLAGRADAADRLIVLTREGFATEISDLKEQLMAARLPARSASELQRHAAPPPSRPSKRTPAPSDLPNSKTARKIGNWLAPLTTKRTSSVTAN